MADGIPFTPAAPYQPQNPLQNISNLESIAQRQQAMEQQAIATRAKLAVGRHMQNALDPATNDIDKGKFFQGLAADPDAGPEFMNVVNLMAQKGEIDARTLGLHLENKAKEMDIAANMFVPMLDKVAQGKGITKSELWGLAGEAVHKGLYKDSNEAINVFTAMTGTIADSDKARAELVRRMAMQNENGRQALKANMLDYGTRFAPTEVIGPGGVKGRVPAGETPFVPPGARKGFGQSMTGETTAEGTPAPRSSPLVGQGESPSAPLANFVPSEPTPQTAQAKAYLSDTEGKHWLRKKEAEAQESANVSSQFETSLLQQADLLKNFEQGPLMDARSWTAEKLEGLGLPKGVVDSLMGAKNKGMDAVSAVQAARKGIYTETINALQQLPGLSRLAVYELQQAKTAIPTIETKKEAADVIFKHLQNTINIAKKQADLTGRYAQWSLQNPENKRAFSESTLEQSIRDILKHEGLLREGPITTKEKK